MKYLIEVEITPAHGYPARFLIPNIAQAIGSVGPAVRWVGARPIPEPPAPAEVPAPESNGEPDR